MGSLLESSCHATHTHTLEAESSFSVRLGEIRKKINIRNENLLIVTRAVEVKRVEGREEGPVGLSSSSSTHCLLSAASKFVH